MMWRPYQFLIVGVMGGLFLLGCASVKVLESGAQLFPFPHVSNYQQLVSVYWLSSLLEFQATGDHRTRPPTYEADHFVILEASWGPLEKARHYRSGHIPGAIHIDTDDFENGSPRWRLRSVAELHRVIGDHGITPESTVIVYGEQLIAAARVWWILKYAGVEDARLLDGGFGAWKAAGLPVETTIRRPRATAFAAEAKRGYLATTEYVASHLDDGTLWLGDVRSEAEFLGTKSGYSYLDAKGRILGAIHLGDADDKKRIYCRQNGFLRDPSEILSLWQDHGILPDGTVPQGAELILYCGGGWRSSLAFFYAALLGLENVRNYSDGWSGWSTVYQADSEAKGSTPGWRQDSTQNPRETGAP